MKVAIFFGTGYEEIEALAVVDVLRRADIQITMVGVNGDRVTSSRGITICMDKKIEDIVIDDYDMLVLPGGIPGVDNLYANSTLTQTIKNFKMQNKWLAAICAAPSILGKLGVLQQEKATCYPGFEDTLDGCEYIDQSVVCSNHIITAKGAGVSLDFAFKILEVIKGKEVVEGLRKGMMIA